MDVSLNQKNVAMQQKCCIASLPHATLHARKSSAVEVDEATRRGQRHSAHYQKDHKTNGTEGAV